MDYTNFNSETVNRNLELQRSEALPILMRKVYVWMTFALIITGLTAASIAFNPALLSVVMGSPLIIFGSCIAVLIITLVLSSRITSLSLTTATVLFIVFSVLMGVSLASIFLVYTLTSITSVFFITAGTFAAMSFVGYTTKKDLSSMGGLLFMALIGLIIATVVNLFVASSWLDLIISYAGVLIFVGLTAWDTQTIKRMLSEADSPSEDMQKLAVIGALSLYLDFINLFIHLLKIFGRKD